MTSFRNRRRRQRLTATAAALLAGLAPFAGGPHGVGAAVAAIDGSPEVAQRGGVFAFDIPAQDLNDAVLAFAETSGIRAFYDTTRFEGLTARPVSGSHPAEQALRLLLQGTGVTFTFENDRSVVLERHAATRGLLLSPRRRPGPPLLRPDAGRRSLGAAAQAGRTRLAGRRRRPAVRACAPGGGEAADRG